MKYIILGISTFFMSIVNLNRPLNIVVEADSQGTISNCGVTSWPFKLDSLYTFTDTVINRSVGGQKVQQMNLNLSTHLSSAYQQYANNICVMWIGVNNLIVDAESVSSVIGRIDSSITIVKNENYDLYLCTQRIVGTTLDTITKFRTQLISLAALRNVEIIDLYNYSDWNYAGAYLDRDFYCDDNIHLTDSSHYIISTLVKAKLDSMYRK